MKISSKAFAHHAAIPARCTCDGDDASPALAWSDAPAGTKSFVLVVEDPDAPDPAAPQRTWTHWVLYNLPASCTGLPESVHGLPPGTLQGVNDWGRTGYGGPCPPVGEHRYFHRLYAVDAMLPDLHRPNARKLMDAMREHLLAEASLVGTYRRRN